jgi:hypothetical protein
VVVDMRVLLIKCRAVGTAFFRIHQMHKPDTAQHRVGRRAVARITAEDLMASTRRERRPPLRRFKAWSLLPSPQFAGLAGSVGSATCRTMPLAAEAVSEPF